MIGLVSGQNLYLHEGMCMGKCEWEPQGRACMIMWMLELQLGNNFICLGLCEDKSGAEHVCEYMHGLTGHPVGVVMAVEQWACTNCLGLT